MKILSKYDTPIESYTYDPSLKLSEYKVASSNIVYQSMTHSALQGVLHREKNGQARN